MTQATHPDKRLGADLSAYPREALNERVNAAARPSGTRLYSLPAQLRVRLMGAALVGIAVVLLVMTLLVALLQLPQDILSLLVVLVVVAVFGLGFLLVRRWYVVRLDEQGYEVRFVRGAGTRKARWNEVEDLVTNTIEGADVVVLRLRDGRSTTIPVAVVEGDQEEFVDELRGRLDPGARPRRRR